MINSTACHLHRVSFVKIQLLVGLVYLCSNENNNNNSNRSARFHIFALEPLKIMANLAPKLAGSSSLCLLLFVYAQFIFNNKCTHAGEEIDFPLLWASVSSGEEKAYHVVYQLEVSNQEQVSSSTELRSCLGVLVDRLTVQLDVSTQSG